MNKYVALGLFVVGVIHLLPVVGVMGSEKLTVLYGVNVNDPNMALLLRHRAVLFGIVGGLLLCAVWLPYLRVAAWCAGTMSVSSFLLLAWLTPSLTQQNQTVVWVDVFALFILLMIADPILKKM